MSETLDEGTFEDLAADTLSKLEGKLADLDERLDVTLSMGVLTLSFDSGAKFVINSHRAARQIWMAAHASAWHFDWNGTTWISTKSGEELFDVAQRAVSEALGKSVSLTS